MCANVNGDQSEDGYQDEHEDEDEDEDGDEDGDEEVWDEDEDENDGHGCVSGAACLTGKSALNCADDSQEINRSSPWGDQTLVVATGPNISQHEKWPRSSTNIPLRPQAPRR